MNTFRSGVQRGGMAVTVMAVLLVAAAAAIGWLLWADREPQGTGPRGPVGSWGGGGQEVGVLIEEVGTMNFAARIEALGTARANESVDITAKVSGLVSAIRFKEGQRIDRNAVVVELESREAEANLAEAQAALVEIRSQYDRSLELFNTRAVSQSSLDELKAQVQANEARVQAARARLDDYIVRAPFSGRVGLRNVSPGSLVSPGQVITTLDDTSTIKLDFAVPETFLATITERMNIVAESAAYPEIAFGGEVTSIDTRVDPMTRSVAVRAELPNEADILKPGMFLTVTLLQEDRLAVAVPEQALVPEQDLKFVFVVVEGIARRRQIETGRRRPGFVEVVDGLNAGELVIVEGTQKVRDGSPVRNLASLAANPAG